MLILPHNFKFNIWHHLVVVDDIVGGGTILCDGSLSQVTYEEVKLKLYNRSSIAQTACVLMILSLVPFMELHASVG